MQQTAEELRATVETVSPQLLAITEAESEARPTRGKWSKKEILGHLIDSASNNHQRFVRTQLQGELDFPGYEQEGWVETQSYLSESWEQLVQLWKSYNLHLAHVISRVPEEKLKSRVVINNGDPVSLELIMIDYVRHLKHHLEQIFR